MRFVSLFSLLVLASSLTAQTVTVDFGNRAVKTYPIPSTMFGFQYSHMMPSATLEAAYSAGFRYIRMYAWLQSIYGTRTPNWSYLDNYMNQIQAINVGKTPGFRVILEITYTPPWMIPTVSGCPVGGPSYANKVPPTDLQQWALLAQSIVAHVDKKYPGIVTDFEVWNEPELPTFCVYPNTLANRLSRYLALYSAAAPLIRQQLVADGVTARIGGPTISNTSNFSQVIGSFLSTASTANYVDFVSYHRYFAGDKEIVGGMLWDKTSSTGVTSLFSRIQLPSVYSGVQASYMLVANTVKAGKQANPTKTRIYLDEFNDDWNFSDDCCRNHATYSPVFNGLLMLDIFDSVYAGAPKVPDVLAYYSMNNPPFCLIGDTGGHCGKANYSVLYPQFYLYYLLAGSNYLNLSTAGGYMAVSATPRPSGALGLASTGFWSGQQDSIVIVNSSSTTYSSVKVIATNPGFTVGKVTKYLLNSSNKTITSSSLTFTNSGTTATTVTLTVPGYSVIGVKFAPAS